ncbi:MAG: 2-C-methyl-D-erythritol 4-phosphate cytidylyltransferase [Deltaproteobacteria bacterium]|nr:2-C-methyl-D-erythritol 4-phosphate cytidylyltransferase [Deltaproteobacteria bacterium]MBW1952825.1 2-C-methyl-D-erythritol 4-phosphate cytidylyltransferase [Deltaproteobacteria bacterium]MBW1986783.1 2-C-methyl-D-erythritol 4-phosphate cytidylyltransferase [Deltaproteobacteria bacterium]MBW2135287.1 2-C-methyl-D-erythritol 4-phosphate cytidylyltransferase [Deltaproteobacteria bacterium]
MTVAAIVPAAGVGRRMGHKIPKPYLPLAGKPILAHTLAVFESLPEIDEITVVTHPAELEFCQEKILVPYGFQKVLRLVPGGKERQDSVYHALKILYHQEDLEIIVVHDGVRPFVTPEAIRQTIQVARDSGAAILAQPAQDTIKRVNKKHQVQETLDRRDLWLVQTPQAFKADLLWKAFVEAYARNFFGTDEASLLEQLGVPVTVVKGSPYNLKITTPEDLHLAEILLKMRQKSKHARRTRI